MASSFVRKGFPSQIARARSETSPKNYASTLALAALIWGALIVSTSGAFAQSEPDAPEPAQEQAELDEGLLTQEELQNLVAPIALFPDTLLIQIAVAATQPFEIMKAERLLLDNADLEQAQLEEKIKAQGWDASVEVLAIAFPEVIAQMATHVDWTETLGTAMLAQSDDVMDAVQVMRQSAINSGALISGPEQTVETVEEEVVITPTDPEVVYVPQYDSKEVYSGPSTGEIVGGVLITYTIIKIIDEIFDDDDDWYGYWGCRNCGGWGGRPIIRNPNVDINIDGDVNIGNGNIGWRPEPRRQEEARDKIRDRNRADTGRDKLPVTRADGRSNELRDQLTRRTGATDISRGAGNRAGGSLPARGADANRLPSIDTGSRDLSGRKNDALKKTHDRSAAKSPAVKSKPKATKKPATKKTTKQHDRNALQKRSSGHRAKSASSRGKQSRGKARR